MAQKGGCAARKPCGSSAKPAAKKTTKAKTSKPAKK